MGKEGKTTVVPRLRFSEFRDAPEWESWTLGDIALISSGRTPLRSNPEFYEGRTIPWVKTTAWLNAKVYDWKRIANSSRKDPNITGSNLARFPIQIPSIDEQQRITDCLTSLDTQITAETEKLAALKTHKKGLVRQLFPIPLETEKHSHQGALR